jgi:hypothetical protein
MPSPSEDARLDPIPAEQIASLAELYDRFAHALDPFDSDRDKAEQMFEQEIASWYDVLPGPPKPNIHEFRKAVILRCKRHLAQKKFPSV